MKTLKQLLANKNRPLAVVAPGDSVFHALTVMSQNNVAHFWFSMGSNLSGYFPSVTTPGKSSCREKHQRKR